MRRLIMTVAILFLCVLLAAPAALAQGGEKEQQGERRAGQWLEQRGEKLQQRIELIITRFENNKERHIKAYNEAKEKVERFLEAAEAKGYDVTKLAQDLSTWDAMIVKFAQDYAAFIAKLKEISELAVGRSEGQFRAELKEARRLLRQVQQDALDIRLYYQQTIRADIQALKGQIPSAT